MKRFDLARFRRDPKRFGRDAKQPGGFAQVEIWLDSILCRPVDGYPVVGAQRGHSLAGPAVAIAGDKAVPVESARDQIVIGDQHEMPDRRDDVGWGTVALTLSPTRQAKLGM